MQMQKKELREIPFSITGKIINRGSWRIFKPVIDYKKCTRCLICWLYCPDAAYRLDKNNYPRPDEKTCKGCGICSNECPVKCIKMERDLHKKND